MDIRTWVSKRKVSGSFDIAFLIEAILAAIQQCQENRAEAIADAFSSVDLGDDQKERRRILSRYKLTVRLSDQIAVSCDCSNRKARKQARRMAADLIRRPDDQVLAGIRDAQEELAS
jgi:hypothetical protein